MSDESRKYRDYWTVPRMWEGETVFIIGGGPSLKHWDITGAALPRLGPVLAINNAYELEPWADMLYYADSKWYGWNHDKFKHFLGQHIVTRSNPPKGRDHDHRIKVVGRAWGQALSSDPCTVAGWCSGANAINITYHAGAKRAVLLGFDMKANGNWHQNHKEEQPGAAYFNENVLPSMTNMAKVLVDRMHVINATPGSALSCFEMASPRDFGIEMK